MMKIDLRKFRKDKRLSQKDVGVLFGTGQANISMLENENRDLTDEQYQILINTFGESEILKYSVIEIEQPVSIEGHVPITLDAWEIIKKQTQIISSQQEVIKSQQNTIDFLSKKDSTAINVKDANAVV